MRLGSDGEARVALALERKGWTVLSRNWRGGGGELDLVVSRNACLRFVEVKTRSVSGSAVDESVDGTKRRRLVRAAQAWLCSAPESYEEMAFLVVLVEPTGLTWYDDAFDVE
ncbi:MAG: YraN family protein [Myxococcota bacterium]|nr:YraN family protein [Myxococcota bacterium]